MEEVIYSFGFQALNVHLLECFDDESQSVLWVPTDPYFTFFPPILPSLATQAVRTHNWDPSITWWIWLPWDSYTRLYTWRPEWDKKKKLFLPLKPYQMPVQIPNEKIPPWCQQARELAYDLLKNDTKNYSYFELSHNPIVKKSTSKFDFFARLL